MSDSVCISREHQLVDALFDELDAAGLDDFNGHMEACAGCREAFAQLQQTLMVTASVEVPEMDDAYWTSYNARLAERIAAAGTPSRISLAAWWVRRKQSLVLALAPRPAVLQWSAALALVVIGVLIGRAWDWDQLLPQPGNGLQQEAGPLSPAQLTDQTQQYLDRSKVLLLGLVNFDPVDDDPPIMHLAHQRVIAGELVEEAAGLRAALDAHQEQQLSTLIEELELILLQIANLEVQQDVPSIELIQRGVDGGALLLKINLEKMKFSDQQTTDRTDADEFDASRVF